MCVIDFLMGRAPGRVLFGTLLIVFSLPAGAGDWILDEENQCAVWNPYPAENESISWEGDCVNGKASGSGIVHWRENGEESQKAEGEFVEGRLNGKGKLSWGTGHRYDGEFRDSEFEGQGVFLWPDGSRYEGSFSEGERHGKGLHTDPSGLRYEGPYYRGHRHGEGRCFVPGRGWAECRWFQGEQVRDAIEV